MLISYSSESLVDTQSFHVDKFFVYVFMLGLDVVRTDRTLVFYEKQENLAKLWDILSVYAWFDKDVNYCQGGCHIIFVI